MLRNGMLDLQDGQLLQYLLCWEDDQGEYYKGDKKP